MWHVANESLSLETDSNQKIKLDKIVTSTESKIPSMHMTISFHVYLVW